MWDATRAVVGDANGDARPDTADIHTFYRPSRPSWAWDESARYTRHSVEFLSRYLWPYAYPQMTSLDGVVSCSGMEYPMLTCVGGRRDSLTLYSVIVHETAHMWFPMQVGSDEKRYAWQDEGLTRFNQTQALREFYPAWVDTYWGNVHRTYANLARAGGEVELMRHGDLYPPGSSYGVASYQKMALALHALRSILGVETFDRAYREYGKRWVNRHPTPYDLFNTFSHVSGRDLSWFWRTWMYETWPLDHAIASVTEGADGSATIIVEDRGMAPMPARVTVARADGVMQTLEVPVETWIAGARSVTLRVGPGARVTRVELDADRAFPDVDRANDAWQAGQRR
jgi:aminopeptidase N